MKLFGRGEPDRVRHLKEPEKEEKTRSRQPLNREKAEPRGKILV